MDLRQGGSRDDAVRDDVVTADRASGANGDAVAVVCGSLPQGLQFFAAVVVAGVDGRCRGAAVWGRG